MVKKIKIEFKVGDIVKVSVLANNGIEDFYGEVVQEDILIGFSISGEDIYGPYFLVKGVCGKTACVSKGNMSEATEEELDAEISLVKDEIFQGSEAVSELHNIKVKLKKIRELSNYVKSGTVEEWVEICKELLEEVKRMRKGIRKLIEKVDDKCLDNSFWIENDLEEILELEDGD